MAIHLKLIGATPFPQIAAGTHALWQYQVKLDKSVTEGSLGLGLSALVDIRDPAAFAAVVELQNTALVNPGNGIQFVVVDVAGATKNTLDIYFVAPSIEDSFTSVALAEMTGELGTPQLLPFRTDTGSADNTAQVLHGPAASKTRAADTGGATPGGPVPTILPYASEPFGVYQPLMGWRSALNHDKLSAATSNRVARAASLMGDSTAIMERTAIGTVPAAAASVDRTGTAVGRQLAAHLSSSKMPTTDRDWKAVLAATKDSPLATITHDVVSTLRQSQAVTPAGSRLAEIRNAAMINSTSVAAEEAVTRETTTATLLHYLGKTSPETVAQLFRATVEPWRRVLASAEFFSMAQPAQSAFLSPIGILHLFREYFFELGTFLGPPVGHVWLSPGGTVELVEVNTRRTLVENTVEQSTETDQKTELDQTDQDELSDAVKVENANDTKLGVTATASGGVAGVYQASGSASFNLDSSRKQAQEQTHKQMREQSSKLSSEVRQNYKTTFRTVTETTDTSSRRYVLQNTSGELVSYELSRKMRKVAVQVQDLGQQLCWQLYIDRPGDTLGLGEFVHSAASALDPGVKPPDYAPVPANQQKTISLVFPFNKYQGSDDDAENNYTPNTDDGRPDEGQFNPDVGKRDIIQFTLPITLPPPPAGFTLAGVGAIDFKGASVDFTLDAPDLKPNPNITTNTLTIRLTHAFFDGKKQLPFDVTLNYTPDKATVDAITASNATLKTQYDDQVAAKKEQLFYDTLRTRLKLVGQVKPRPQQDLREEERSVVYRAIISRLYGNESGWTNDDYHVASELIRYLFDIDSMLYFVAPDWWRPRSQPLVSKSDQSELQPTIIADPAMSARVLQLGLFPPIVIPGHRPYYLITEETEPAPRGASLGWLIQLDGDTYRNAFLNSPWVKAVLPIRPGRERDAIAWLQRPEVAGTDGLGEPYPFDPAQDPPEYKGLTLEQVLLKIADKIAAEYQASLTPVVVDPAAVNPQLALPTEVVFTHGFDPLDGGIKFGSDPFKVFSQWIEILPTDQVVATEYNLSGL